MVGPISRGDSSEPSSPLPESGEAIQMLSRGPLLPANAVDRFSPYSPKSYGFNPESPVDLKSAYQALHQVQELFPLDPEEAQAFIDAIVGER